MKWNGSVTHEHSKMTQFTKVLYDAQWLERPNRISETVIGSNPVEDLDFFFVTRSWQHFVFIIYPPSCKLSILHYLSVILCHCDNWSKAQRHGEQWGIVPSCRAAYSTKELTLTYNKCYYFLKELFFPLQVERNQILKLSLFIRQVSSVLVT